MNDYEIISSLDYVKTKLLEVDEVTGSYDWNLMPPEEMANNVRRLTAAVSKLTNVVESLSKRCQIG